MQHLSYVKQHLHQHNYHTLDQYCFDWNGTEQCYNVVNSSSYSGSDGIASTIIGVHEEHIGNIVKVYCGYYTDYGTQYLDSLEVIIDE